MRLGRSYTIVKNSYQTNMADSPKPGSPTVDHALIADLVALETDQSSTVEEEHRSTSDPNQGPTVRPDEGQLLVNVHQGSREDPEVLGGATPRQVHGAPTPEAAFVEDPKAGEVEGGVPLTIPSLPDVGSDASAIITIARVPENVILTAGTSKGGGVFELSAADALNVRVLPVDDGFTTAQIESLTFDLTVVQTDPVTGDSQTLSATVQPKSGGRRWYAIRGRRD